jgi:hypothetical protein
VGEFTQDDQENNKAGDPAVHLIDMDNLVAEEGDEESAGGDDDNSSESRHLRVDSVDQLRANNNIDSGPAQACKAVEESNFEKG